MSSRMKNPAIDPITLSVVWNKLLNITREAGERIMHSAQSFVMANARDLGMVLLNDKGQILIQTEFVMVHCGVGELATKAILDRFGGKLYPGDCILANDAHIIKSGHLPDWTILVPIYWHDELVFYCHFRGHMMDTGGAYSGGYFPRAYDCIAEGLNIPPVKIIDRGKVNEELFGLILRNVRNSAGVRSDNMLAYGSMIRAEKDIGNLIDKYGLDTVRRCCDEMIRLGEEGMRGEIRKIPEGMYTGETAADWDGTKPDRPVWVRVELTVKGDEMTLDFTGSNKQVDFINSPLGNTYASAYLAIFLTLGLTIPLNHGAMVPIKIIAPEGTVVNPTYPHTYGSCALIVGQHISEVCLEALGKAIPEKAVAPSARHLCPFFVGRDPRPEMMIDPRTEVVREYFGGPFASPSGTGAVKGFDGWEGTGIVGMLGLMFRGPFEKAEIFYPVSWRCVELAQDTEGPGEFTGCTGTYVEMECQSKEGFPCIVMTGNSDGAHFSPIGQAGAPPAPLHEMYICRPKKQEREVLRTVDMALLEPGDVVITEAGGGGGWGNPLDRDVERVREDVKEEVVSIQRARDVYGVVIDPKTLTVDYNETEQLKKKMREKK